MTPARHAAMSIVENWQVLEADVARYARGAVTIVAVTKQRSVAEVRAVLAAGARVLGENRVEEARGKYAAWDPRTDGAGVQMHMIGHVQSRKARDAAALFDCVQSVDSLRLARELDARCAAAGRQVEVLLELNISGEEQKYGLPPADAESVAAAVMALPSLRLRGLMTMAPYTDDEQRLRAVFRGARTLCDALAARFGAERFSVLSMGMSHDYRLALQEGSTMIRIGTALFEAPQQGVPHATR